MLQSGLCYYHIKAVCLPSAFSYGFEKHNTYYSSPQFDNVRRNIIILSMYVPTYLHIVIVPRYLLLVFYYFLRLIINEANSLFMIGTYLLRKFFLLVFINLAKNVCRYR